MSSVEERLMKLREERMAREKARIEKLREFNLKKYTKNEPQTLKRQTSNASMAPKPSTSAIGGNIKKDGAKMKNNFHVNNTTKRPIIVPPLKKSVSDAKSLPFSSKLAPKTSIMKPNKVVATNKLMTNKERVVVKNDKPTAIPRKSILPSRSETVKVTMPLKEIKLTSIKPFVMTTDRITFRKSLAPNLEKPKYDSRKSLQPTKLPKSTASRESVFDRLYKPKVVTKKPVNEAEKIHSDPKFFRKLINNTAMIVNKRPSLCEPRPQKALPVRRSISAVHFKRISKSELANCNRKWSSIDEKLDKVHLTEINEDETVKQDKVVSAIKSERKKVQFQTPVRFNLNTPRPEELQSRLQAWLQKRGKSLNSFHHLQCFGIHLEHKIAPLNLDKDFDEENKENIALEHDSDNESYTDNINDQIEVFSDAKEVMLDEWRRASIVSDSGDLNETRDSNTTLTSGEVIGVHHVDELMLGALNDLTELLREGFEWEQCARWLRAIRDRFPLAPETAAYWECRAALEERRGDLPASVQCWEEAMAMGTERSVVESNLDHLLDKFMQLKISPNSGKKQVNPKMVDVKNVFKSTIIRFAVQQAKLRNPGNSPIYTMTPVRRSGRLSNIARTPLSARTATTRLPLSARATRTPLALCPTVKQAEKFGPVLFVPNETLCAEP